MSMVSVKAHRSDLRFQSINDAFASVSQSPPQGMDMAEY